MVRRLVGASIAAFASALGACSLLTDTGDLTGASAVADGSIAPDAHLTNDAAPGADTGSADADPSVDGDANKPDASVPCPSGSMVFCDDFERADLLGKWSRQKVTTGSTLAIARDGGGILRATMPAPPAGGSMVEADLVKDFATDATSCFLDFDFRYSKVPSTDPLEVTAIYWDHGTTYEAVYLAVRPSKVTITEEQSGGAYVFSDIGMTPGAWHHVTIEAHVGGMLLVSVDGVIAVQKPMASFFKPGPPSLVAGISYAGTPSTALDVDTDNIVFRALP